MKYQLIEDRQYLFAVVIELLQAVAKKFIVILMAMEPFFQQYHWDVNVAAERLDVMAAQEKAVEHGGFTPRRERIGEVPIGTEEFHRRCGFGALHGRYETTSINGRASGDQ